MSLSPRRCSQPLDATRRLFTTDRLASTRPLELVRLIGVAELDVSQRMPLNQRTTPLKQPEIDEFFDPSPRGHLKYRLTMLLAWKERTQKNDPMPFQDAICGFEAALIACRLFIQFLGLRISHRPTLHLCGTSKCQKYPALESRKLRSTRGWSDLLFLCC